MNNSRKSASAKPWVKACALSVVMCFVLPIASWAFEPVNYAGVLQPGMVLHLGKAVTVSAKYGAVDKAYQGQKKTVIVIHDLHCNYEVQKNIAAMIAELVHKQDLKLVAVEGASGAVDPGLIRRFPFHSVRDAVSDFMVKQGLLTGADFYASTAKKPVILEGIETPALYDESLTTARSFLTAEVQGSILDLRESLDSLKPALYNKALLDLDHLKQQYRMGKLDLFQYANRLLAKAHKHGLGHDGTYPQIDHYIHLNQKWPASAGTNIDQLYQELNRLDQSLRQVLYTTDKQKQLDDRLKRLDIMEKLLNISATQEELADFRKHRENYRIQEFLDFIHTGPLMELSGLNQALNRAGHFYQLADERSLLFVDYLTKAMDQHGQSLAVMITGGFHAEKVLKELKKRHISYLSVTPKVTRVDVVNPYFELLQNRHTPLESLLVKNQTILAYENQLQALANNPIKRMAVGLKLYAAALAEGLAMKTMVTRINETKKLDYSIAPGRALPSPVAGVQAFTAVKEGTDDTVVVLAASKPFERYGLAPNTPGMTLLPTAESSYAAVFESEKAYQHTTLKPAPSASINVQAIRSNVLASIKK